MLVQPFGVQCPVPPIEYKILEYKVEKNLRYNNRPAENIGSMSNILFFQLMLMHNNVGWVKGRGNESLPVWKRKRAPKAHEFEGRVGENHDRQVHTDMVENETQDASVLISRGVALLLQTRTQFFVEEARCSSIKIWSIGAQWFYLAPTHETLFISPKIKEKRTSHSWTL